MKSIRRKDYLGEVAALAWKFVTLPNPLIVEQPEKFGFHLHSEEYGHWNKKEQGAELEYTRPVVYRNYEGVVASKGWVANIKTSYI